MIDFKTAARYIEQFRIAGLDFAPEPDGAKTLAKMLAKHALSDAHAGTVVASWISHWPKWPRPSDIKQFCEATPDPQMAQARAERSACTRCQGTGYITVDGPHGLSAAYPCTHQPETEAESRLGVKLNPAMAKRYAAEARESDQRHIDWLKRRAAGEVKGFHKVSQSDIDNLLASIGEMRC